MKKTALLALSLFVASQSHAETGIASQLHLSPNITGSVKLLGSAARAAFALLTLKHSWTNFRASRPVANQPGWFNLAWPYRYTPVPAALMPAQDKSAQRELSQYQFGTTGFGLLLAKRLFDSGMSDFSSSEDII